ncbi:hypothetical protein FBUS_09289 [Fasciolopsis buskii]|uniref:Protein BCCIP homolog n=1 Tax=Fasciolopsis buskii TaxID=27845 RepID=A0A8E0VQJ1_9TREM|nr:hypothetical protein FBUS_09289 [Fasciolopsis buski]
MPKKQSRVDFDAPQTVVELELEGFAPSDSDRGGIVRLLSHIFANDCEVKVEQIADLIIQNNQVGSVIKQVDETDEDDEDDSDDNDAVVFALISAVDISVNATVNDGTRNLRSFLFNLLNHADVCHEKTSISELLTNSTVRICFVISERLETLPLSVCAGAVEILPGEMKSANMYPSHLVMVFRAYETDATNHELNYYYEEFKYIEAFSLHKLTVRLGNSTDGGTVKSNIFTILVILMDKFSDILDGLQSHL